MEQTDQVPAADDNQPQSKRANRMSIVASRVGDTFGDISSTSQRDEMQLGNSDGQQLKGFNSLPFEIMSRILSKLSYQQLFQLKVVSREFNDHMSSNVFHNLLGSWRPQEGLLLTAIHFVAGMNGVWQCLGYDLNSTSWKKLPPIQMLPRVDPALLECLICGAGGMMCANIATSSSSRKEIMVFNPLTGNCMKLPPLNHGRNPALMHMVMDSTGASYKIIAAGSARRGHEEHLLKITEVYDSRTGTWTRSQDVPGRGFALHEDQSGVFRDGILYCIAGVGSSGKAILAFHVEQGVWLPHLSCPWPSSAKVSIVHLLECCGEIYLFTVIEHGGGVVQHRIDLFEIATLHTDLRSSNLPQPIGAWKEVFAHVVIGRSDALEVCRCVPFGEGKLCIFESTDHTGIVYDLRSREWNETLLVGIEKSTVFITMNSLTFSFEPSFRANP